MDLSLPVALLAFVLAIPMSIAANLLTPKVAHWWATTSEARRRKRIERLQAELKKLTQADNIARPLKADSPLVKHPVIQPTHTRIFRLDNDFRALGIVFKNTESRYPTTAHNVVPTLTYAPFRGEPLKLRDAPWQFTLAVSNPIIRYSHNVSFGMADERELIVLLCTYPADQPGPRLPPDYLLPRFDGIRIRPDALIEYGEWTVTIELEGDNFSGQYVYKIAIGPSGDITPTLISV